jgi:hypothetical protein
MHPRTKLIRENALQAYLIQQVRKAGGFAVKITSPSRRGIPDVLIIYLGRVYFVEVKMNLRSKPTPIQSLTHREMKKAGGRVDVVSGKEEAAYHLSLIFNRAI